ASYFSDFANSFRLPLFFILSGFLSHDKRLLTLKNCLSKYGKRLLIPYFSAAILLFLFWLFLGRHYGDPAGAELSPLKNFAGIFYAQGGAEFMDWGIPLWFLPALFCIIMLDFFVSRLNQSVQPFMVVTFSLSGYFIYQRLGYHLPWSLDIAMVVYLFYFSGKLFRKYDLMNKTDKKEWLFILVPIFLHLGIAHYTPNTTFYRGEYGILPLSYLTGILGFLWLFHLLKLLPTWKPIVWVGKNTLPILAFHLLAISTIKVIALWLFNIEITFNLWNSLGLAALQILLLTPVILLMNQYVPFLAGKWGQRKDLMRHSDEA
ncbi:MAG: acyltransferase family protein, partial [Marinilabilia sp.]